MAETLDGIVIGGIEYDISGGGGGSRDTELGDRAYEGGTVQYKTDYDEYIGHIDDDGIHAKDFFVKQNGQEVNIKDLSGGNVDISLPDKIYAVVGDTLQLFYRGIIKAVDPYRFDILVACSKGKQTPRFFEYTPAAGDVGSTTFKLSVKDDNGNTLASKTATLVTVAVPSSPSSTKNILCFGDSLTSAGTWCAEAYRRLTQSGGTPAGKSLSNIVFCGQKTNAGAGYFGEGGWSWNDYTTEGRPATRFYVNGITSLSLGAVYTDGIQDFTIREINVTSGTGNILCNRPYGSKVNPATSGTLTKKSGSGDSTITYSNSVSASQNPVWDYTNNKVSFTDYATKYCNGQIDVVYTLLSWNGQSAHRTDFSSVTSAIKKFADALHSEFPNAKLKILGIQLPSLNGGVGANYGASGSGYSDQYGSVVTVLNQNKAYQDFANQDAYKSFVEFVNVSSQFDSEYNMPETTTPVNTRNSVTERRGTNGCHPSTNGYLQIGDIVYRNICATI